MTSIIYKTILFSLLNFTIYSTVFAQSADEICKQHIEKMGGKALLSKLNTVTIDQQLLQNNSEFPQKVVIINNKAIYTDASYQGIRVVTAVCDNSGWEINPYTRGGTQPQKLTQEEVLLYKYPADLLGPLYDPESKGATITLLGKEKVLGQETFKLNLAYKTGYSTDINVTCKDYFVVKIASEGKEILYTDYKKVDGYWFPFSTEMKYGGYSTVFNVFKIKVNAAIDEKIFDFPKG